MYTLKYDSITDENILQLIGRTEFHPFILSDYQCFGGVETENPMIGETEDGELCIIFDGSKIEVIELNTGNAKQFHIAEM